MPSTPTAEPLADAAWAFLERALDELVPERDVPAARELCAQIVEAWPVDDEGWEAARMELAEGLAEHLAMQPRAWARALRLVSLYLNRAILHEPHPRHDTPMPVTQRGRRLDFVEFELSEAFGEALLGRSDAAQRMILYDTLDEWPPWKAVAQALARLRPLLDAEEIATLLTRAVRFTRGDSAAGEVLEPLREALMASTEGIDALLESWFERMDLDPSVIGLLALWRLPEREDGVNLRRRLVRQLLRLPPKQGAWSALHVAFRSWPAGVEFDARREAVLECLEHLGAEGVLPALAALAYDRDTRPQGALSLLDAIVSTIDDANEHSTEIAIARVTVLRWIVREHPKGEALDVQAIVDRLPSPAALPADEHKLRQLDWLLSTLARRNSAPVRAYVLDWIETHAASLGSQGIDQLLPETSAQLPGARWLIEAAVSRRPGLRYGALRCLLHSKTRVVPEDFAELADEQVLALAHMTLSGAAVGAGAIDLLFDLAQARLDRLSDLLPLLGEEALRTYPGQHRRRVVDWAAAVEDRPEQDPERVAVKSLQALLDARKAAAQVKRALAPMIFERTSPARLPVMEAYVRAFHEGENQSLSLFRMIATEVPIACGAASTYEFGDADARTPRPFQEVSGEMEVPSLDAWDPVAAHFFRLSHEQQVQQLLGLEEEST
jgi:hypothetical protein